MKGVVRIGANRKGRRKDRDEAVSGGRPQIDARARGSLGTHLNRPRPAQAADSGVRPLRKKDRNAAGRKSARIGLTIRRHRRRWCSIGRVRVDFSIGSPV